MQNKIKFGTDGWRAIVGEDFNLTNVEALTQGFVDYLFDVLKKRPASVRIAVGYDRRRLAKEAAGRIAEVLSGNGIKVMLSDRALPTQAISYTVKYKKLTAGMMVTASHNPARFNGIKIKAAFGGSMEKAQTDIIESLIFTSRVKRFP